MDRPRPTTSFSLAELRVLAGLAQGMTLAAIGEKLYLSQSSVSKILRNAERRAGLKLVERRGRRIHLAAAGADVARAVQPIAVQLDELDVLLDNLHHGKGGPLRLIASPTAANYCLPHLIGEFLKDFPDVQLALSIVRPEDMLDVFVNEHYHLGVSPTTTYPAGLILERLYEDPVVFFVGPDSPLASRSDVTWAEVRQEPLMVPLSEAHWAQVFQELARRGMPLGRYIDLRAYEGTMRLVGSGYGIGVNVASALHREFQDGRIRPLTIAGVSLTMPFYLIQREHVPLTPVARRFRALLKARLGTP